MRKNIKSTSLVVERDPESGSEISTDGKVANAIYVAAYIIGDIIPCYIERLAFLFDVCLCVTCTVYALNRSEQEMFAPKTEWGRDWARRTGIMSDRAVSSKDIDDYLDELKALKRIPVSDLYQDKSDGGQAKELYDLLVKRTGINGKPA